MTILQFHPPVIAHRGASAYAPENTLAAFTKAAQMGIKWVEFDVMQAACGEPVIFHDELLDRTTDGHGEVGNFPYSVLAKLDAGAWFDPIYAGERIPTLLHILEFLHNFNMSANIEIKALPGQEEQLVKRVLQDMAISAPFTRGRILFSSFSTDALRFLRQYDPDCLIGLLQHEWDPEWQALCASLGCVSVHANDEILTADVAQKIKGMGKALLCYTVNSPVRAQELYSWGVDAVFSDAPDKILDVL